jgi:hypothetical protein
VGSFFRHPFLILIGLLDRGNPAPIVGPG